MVGHLEGDEQRKVVEEEVNLEVEDQQKLQLVVEENYYAVHGYLTLTGNGQPGEGFRD